MTANVIITKYVYELANEGKSRREISRVLDITVFQVFRILRNIKRRHENWNSTMLTKDRKK
jgi:DNA invertase Pin-like site-specific DNA recombinase